MTAPQRFAAWFATAAIVGTGVAYAWLAYAVQPADQFDVVNHPWQPTMLHLHVLAAPLWLFVFGVLWSSHASPKLRARTTTRRRTGLALVGLAVPMAASGYLLQTSVDETCRRLWLTVHLVASALWSVAFLLHLRRRGPSRCALAVTRAPGTSASLSDGLVRRAVRR